MGSRALPGGGGRPATGGLDCFRLLAALLVVANHTSPLSSLSAGADHLLTQVLARVAVPFFLLVTGYFLLPGLEEGGRAALLPFLRRGLLLYAGATLLYLPLQLYKGYRPGAWGLLRDLLFDGTFYHLWYFPALLLGGALVCLLPKGGPLWALLYLAGLLGDSYYGLSAALPAGRGLYDVLFLLFDQTRNGLFLSPLFLYLGGRLARTPPRWDRRAYGLGALAALALLVGEGLLVERLALARFSAMYLSLPLVLWPLFRWLCALDLPQRPGLRRLSAAVYVIHPWMIVGVRGMAKITKSQAILVENSMVCFLSVTIASFAAALLLCRVRPRRAPAPDEETAPVRPGASSPAMSLQAGPQPEGPADLSVITGQISSKDAGQAPSRCWAEIDRAALRHNIALLRSLLPEGCGLMAVVKADGYGHGAVPVAGVCAGEAVDAFAVATVAEGAALRAGGVTGDILVLGRAFPGEFPDALRWDLILTAADARHAGELSAFGRPLRVHAAVDTGMRRLGFPAGDAEAVAALYRDPGLRVEGMFTHLCAADEAGAADAAFTRGQIRAFFTLAARLKAMGLAPGALHVQASAGLLRYPGLPCAYARPGLALYGVGGAGLRPVLTLKCRVAAVRDLAPGDTAGYGRAFTAERPTRLAVLAMGYADGLPRSLGGRGRVLLGGESAPIVGRVCMDQTLCDVTDLAGVCPGDGAVVIGPGLPAEEVARAAGTIPNELLSRLGGRVERVYGS